MERGKLTRRWKIMLTTPLPTRSASAMPFEDARLWPRFPASVRARPAEQHGAGHAFVDISSSEVVRRRSPTGRGMTAEIIHATHDGQTEYRFRAPVHLLAVYEEASRHDGESLVAGLPRST